MSTNRPPSLPTEPVPIATGHARLIRDRTYPNRVLLELDGVPSSALDLDDPLYLDFEYMQWCFEIIQTHFARDRDRDQVLRALHLGAGACALPRALDAAWPKARQLAVEVDPILAQLVRQWFDLPRSPRLRIRVGDARAALEAKQPGTCDVIVRDAFAGAVTPAHLLDVGMAQAALKALAADGVYLANCADGPGMAVARSEVATFAAVFDHVALVAETGQFRGRRRGNVILIGGASARVLETTNGLARRLQIQAVPVRVLTGEEALRWAGGARPLV
jgi:spermidine synthase